MQRLCRYCGERVQTEWEAEEGTAIPASASLIRVYSPHGCQGDWQPVEAPEEPPEAPQPLPKRNAEPPAGKGQREAAVWEAVRDGAHTSSAVARVLGVSYATAAATLWRLANRRAVRPVRYGRRGHYIRWELIGPPLPVSKGGRPATVWPVLREELYRGPRTTRQLMQSHGLTASQVHSVLSRQRRAGQVGSESLGGQNVWRLL